MKPRPLGDSEAHLWLVDPTGLPDADRLSILLTAEEQAQAQRPTLAYGRLERVVTRALVRLLLSAYSDVAPWEWRFSANPYGRPEVATPRLERPLRFNVSHTHGMIAVLVGRQHELGVDVEEHARCGEVMKIAESYFSSLEVSDLRALPSVEQRHRFFRYWTLKEAYIKARGLGLHLPLQQFSFVLRDGESIGIRFDSRLSDDPTTWQFMQVEPSASHLLATAVRRAMGEEIRIVTMDATGVLTAPHLTAGVRAAVGKSWRVDRGGG